MKYRFSVSLIFIALAAAAGLCGVYDAPLFLVNDGGVPSSVKKAITEIMLTRAVPRIVIVGGPASVPPEIIQEIDVPRDQVLVEAALVYEEIGRVDDHAINWQ